MKKLILFLLLFTGYLNAQTYPSPQYNVTTTNTLKIKAPATVTSANFLPAFGSDGVSIDKIDPVYITGFNSVSIAYVESNGNNSNAQIGNSRKPYLTIDAALDALPSTGGVIKIGTGSFLSPTASKIKNNVKFLGNGKPYPNITVTYTNDVTKPNMTTPTNLVGGTILQGLFNLNNKSNIEVHNLGVDCGKTWIDSFNGGVPLDAFRTSIQNASVPNSGAPPATGIVVNNVSALCYSPTALVHSILIENTIGANIKNVNTYYGYHGLVVKSRATNVDGVESLGHDGEGVIVKADTYSYSSDINLNNIYISSISTNDGSGLMIDGGSGNLQRVNISNVNIEFTKYGITDTSTSIEDINLNNITIFKTQGNGIYFGPGSKNVTIDNVKQNGTTAGNGIELNSTGTNIKTLTNATTKNNSQYGIYLVGGSGTINVNNLSSTTDVSGIAISGNVYGANVNSDNLFTGTLTLNTGNINAKNVSSTVGASNSIGAGSAYYWDNNLTSTNKRFFVAQLNSGIGIDFWTFDGSNWNNTGAKINGNGRISAQPGTSGLEVINYNQFSAAFTPGVKRYVALISQSGTSAPVATVLENTLGGTVVWTRGGAGSYTGTLSGAFTIGKTVCLISHGVATSSSPRSLAAAGSAANNNTVDISTAANGSQADSELTRASLEIRVYP